MNARGHVASQINVKREVAANKLPLLHAYRRDNFIQDLRLLNNDQWNNIGLFMYVSLGVVFPTMQRGQPKILRNKTRNYKLFMNENAAIFFRMSLIAKKCFKSRFTPTLNKISVSQYMSSRSVVLHTGLNASDAFSIVEHKITIQSQVWHNHKSGLLFMLQCEE